MCSLMCSAVHALALHRRSGCTSLMHTVRELLLVSLIPVLMQQLWAQMLLNDWAWICRLLTNRFGGSSSQQQNLINLLTSDQQQNL